MNEYLTVSLHIPPKMWCDFQKSMVKSRMFNEEVIGFFFCQGHQSKHKIRYIPKTWVVPASDCYEHQSASGLVLKQHFHSYLLENHLQAGLDIVHIHTHAGGGVPDFSHVDDRYESEYAGFISSHFPTQPHLISGVFDENLQFGQFRIWDRTGQRFEPVDFCHSLFDVSNFQEVMNKTDLMFLRQKIFGSANQQLLHQLKVGLIGCGGIGSIFAELLGRLGVKNWVLVDPDKLETVNLNRMPGATKEMVQQQWYKVHYVKHLIQKIYPEDSCVQTIATGIESELSKQEIATCDLIVVATDNHLSRKTAQELALQYMRPLVCLGTHIEVKPDNTPRMYCRITVPPMGGGWCLMCGNIINLQRAALESAPLEMNQMAAGAGYLEGVNDPAVFWLNSICASTGVGVIHGMVSGFLNVDSGIDWIYEFPVNDWRKTNTEYLQTDNCYFCGMNGLEEVVENSDFENSEFENPDLIIW
ncbi:MAG: ThiF family adenylyltransferase [Rhizonema sp. PD37]|nr:ThiF family adenylyltransferase [Rhizonema sp. PD37]